MVVEVLNKGVSKMRLGKFIVIPLLIISFLLFSSVTANSEDSSIEKRLKALEERNRTLEKNYQDLQEKYEDLQKRIETEAVVQEKPKSSEEQVTEVQELKE
ncbi:MAG: hypothetical protein IH948_05485, partial [Bacteroidetes bacterium]|nr:hypothetical protein [Bacteroidota bacterium]